VAADDSGEATNRTLEAPPLQGDGQPNGDALWRYRAREVRDPRPVFTGDIFVGVKLNGTDGLGDVIVLQHPCALRTDGVALIDRVLVAEVSPLRSFTASEWDGNYTLMPLPKLRKQGEDLHNVAFFDKLHLVVAAELKLNKRVACMSAVGIASVDAEVQLPQHPCRRADLPAVDGLRCPRGRSERHRRLVQGSRRQAHKSPSCCN
jgi:hypothetical protein